MTLDGPSSLAEDRVSTWLTEHLSGLRTPLDFELVANGRSNLTYAVTDATGRVVVLRRPPTGDLLPSAHDVAREHRVISALHGTPVPVPRPLGLCEDLAVTGAPFYVMEYVAGNVIRTRDEAETLLGPDARDAVTDALVAALIAIHTTDLTRTGLSDLARPDRYVERQLKRWRGQLHHSLAGNDGSEDTRFLETAHDVLAAAAPPGSKPTLVHGDFRLGNCIVDTSGRVLAVLDWETCTLGEPLADLATLLVGWNQSDDEDLLGVARLGLTPTAAPGFPRRDEVVARYAADSGRGVTDLPFYVAFGWWRMACVLHGVAARYRGGSGGGEAGRLEVMDARAAGAALAARRALADAGLAVPARAVG